jgi:hypothetical protein
MSVDSILSEDGQDVCYPMEYLQSLTVSGLPLSKLRLKEGCPVMLLRNLDPAEGLCNGMRMIVVERIRRKVLQCHIISKDRRFMGKRVLIPCIVLQPTAEALPIPLN